MEPPELRKRLNGYSASAQTSATRQWRKMKTLDDWPNIVGRLTMAVQANMVAAARLSGGEAVEELQSAAGVNPAAWGSTATDGRPLDSLLYSGVVHARSLYGSGRTDEQILAAGLSWMNSLIVTQVADVSRSASSVVTAGTPEAGWIRYVRTPCCKRCAVQAGKWFKWNQGFLRHPSCKCIHRPAKGNAAPHGWSQVIGAEDIRDLSTAERQAIDLGADMNQVINAARRSSGMTTTEGTSPGGWASYIRRAVDRERGQQTTLTTTSKVGADGQLRNRRHAKPRLTPEAIIRLSATREEAVRRLVENGYMVGNVSALARSVA